MIIKKVSIVAMLVIALIGCKAKKDKYDYSRVESISLDAQHTTNQLRISEPDTVYLDKNSETKKIDFNKE